MLLKDLDTILLYHAVHYSLSSGEPVSLPGNCADMEKMLACLTILLIGTDACTPHIMNLVWGKNNDARHALGGPRGDLSLIRRRFLVLSKIAINTIYIWMMDPNLPIFAPESQSFKRLPPTIQTLLLTPARRSLMPVNLCHRELSRQSS
jgi:hypothetical protein